MGQQTVGFSVIDYWLVRLPAATEFYALLVIPPTDLLSRKPVSICCGVTSIEAHLGLNKMTEILYANMLVKKKSIFWKIIGTEWRIYAPVN